MTTLLEESYRWWLRLLPAWYRLDREEEMVATFMEAAGSGEDAEVARPSWTEIRGVLALAVRTRLGGAGAAPRARAWGEGVRVFALAAVLMQAVFATIAVWDALRGHILTAGPPPPADPYPRLASAVWIALFLTVVLGRWRAARWLALAAVYGVYALSAGPAPVADTPDAVAVAVGLGVLPAVAVMAAFHQDAAPVPCAWPLVALPAGAILIGLWTHLTGPDAPAPGARLAARARAAGRPGPRRAGPGAGRLPRRAAGLPAGLAEHGDHDRRRPGRPGRPGCAGAPGRGRPYPPATARTRHDRVNPPRPPVTAALATGLFRSGPGSPGSCRRAGDRPAKEPSAADRFPRPAPPCC